MKAPLLALIVLATAAGGWYAVEQTGSNGAANTTPLGPSGTGTSALSPSASSAVSPGSERPGTTGTPKSRARGIAELEAAPVAPAVTAAARPGSSRRAVEGTVVDRFGQPLRGERVTLVPSGAGHPAAGADLQSYTTALTSAKGTFSLTIPDDADGDWRLAVGPPGAPRIQPSAPRTLSAGEQVEVVLPGAAAIQVRFDGLPENAQSVTLELLALRDASDNGARRPGRGNRTGGRRGTRGAAEGSQADASQADGAQAGRPQPGERTQRQPTSGEVTAGRGGRGRGRNAQGTQGAGNPGVQGAGTRNTAPPPVPVTDDGASTSPDGNVGAGGGGEQRADGGARGGRAGRGRRGQAAQPNRAPQGGRLEPNVGETGPPVEPAPEVWRPLERRTLSAQEIAAQGVSMRGLAPGTVLRLSLVVDGRPLEGATRFTVQPDTLTTLQIFPVAAGAGPGSVNYVARSKPLGATESPAGVRWSR